MGKPGRRAGKVAVVEIAATGDGPAVLLIEVALDGETLVVSDQERNLTEATRRLAQALIDNVKKELDNGRD